jgi:predicted DNA-binding transcriptional regulator AlpA
MKPMDDLFDFAKRPAPAALATQPIDDELWSVRKIMAKTGLGRSTLYKYVSGGHFPRQRRLGPGRVGWLASDVLRWIGSRPDARQHGD